MHESSYLKMKRILTSVRFTIFDSDEVKCLEVGSKVSDDSVKSYLNILESLNIKHVGLDVQQGKNVHVVPQDPYRWKELSSNQFELVISGQTLEHVTFFWSTVQEMYRVLKPFGILVIIVPSQGPEHKGANSSTRDCWRFLEDGMISIGEWIGAETLLTFTDSDRATWGDSVLVATKRTIELSPNVHAEKLRLLKSVMADIEENFVKDRNTYPDPLSLRFRESIKIFVGYQGIERFRRLKGKWR